MDLLSSALLPTTRDRQSILAAAGSRGRVVECPTRLAAGNSMGISRVGEAGLPRKQLLAKVVIAGRSRRRLARPTAARTHVLRFAFSHRSQSWGIAIERARATALTLRRRETEGRSSVWARNGVSVWRACESVGARATLRESQSTGRMRRKRSRDQRKNHQDSPPAQTKPRGRVCSLPWGSNCGNGIRISNSGVMNSPTFRCFGEGDRRELAVGLKCLGFFPYAVRSFES